MFEEAKKTAEIQAGGFFLAACIYTAALLINNIVFDRVVVILATLNVFFEIYINNKSRWLCLFPVSYLAVVCLSNYPEIVLFGYSPIKVLLLTMAVVSGICLLLSLYRIYTLKQLEKSPFAYLLHLKETFGKGGSEDLSKDELEDEE